MVVIFSLSAFWWRSAHIAAFSAPDSVAGHQQPTPLPETPGHSQAAFLWGSWCTQGFVCTLQESVSQSCVSSVDSMVGLMVTSFKRAYAIPRSAVPRAPAPAAVHCWPIPLQETLKHSSGSVSVESLGPGAYKVCLSPQHFCWVWGLILNVISQLLPSCWGFSFALGRGVSPQIRSSAVQPPLQRLSSCWSFSAQSDIHSSKNVIEQTHIILEKIIFLDCLNPQEEIQIVWQNKTFFARLILTQLKVFQTSRIWTWGHWGFYQCLSPGICIYIFWN